jgi:hypothetical protein
LNAQGKGKGKRTRAAARVANVEKEWPWPEPGKTELLWLDWRADQLEHEGGGKAEAMTRKDALAKAEVEQASCVLPKRARKKALSENYFTSPGQR